MKYLYGIDVGGTTVKLGLFSEDGKLKKMKNSPSTNKSTAFFIPMVSMNFCSLFLSIIFPLLTYIYIRFFHIIEF